jgi:hypothetical protein
MYPTGTPAPTHDSSDDGSPFTAEGVFDKPSTGRPFGYG